MKELMKKAHQMTREIVNKYNDVDYRVQFSLCLSYLIEEEGRKEEMVELKGTEKQVAWAEKIRANAIERLESGNLNKYIKSTLDFNLKVNATDENTKVVVEKMIKMLKEETSAVFFIEKMHSVSTEALLKALLKKENILDIDYRDKKLVSNRASKGIKVIEKCFNEERPARVAEAYELLKEGYEVKARQDIARGVFDIFREERKEQVEGKLFK